MVLTDFLCTECVKKSDLMKSKDLFFFFSFYTIVADSPSC